MYSVSHRLSLAGQTVVISTVLCCSALAQAQSEYPQPGLTPPLNSSVKKADEFLSTLRPPTSVQALQSGSDLLLDFPAIASAGPIRFKVVSTIPRTDAMWLLSLSPQPESGAALFASVTLEPSALPETTFLLNLSKTQAILLVVRAGGKYYGLQREIKVGFPMIGTPAK